MKKEHSLKDSLVENSGEQKITSDLTQSDSKSCKIKTKSFLLTLATIVTIAACCMIVYIVLKNEGTNKDDNSDAGNVSGVSQNRVSNNHKTFETVSGVETFKFDYDSDFYAFN